MQYGSDESRAAKELLIMLMYIHHEVTDYAAWRKVYDAFDATRKELGKLCTGSRLASE